MMDVCGKPLSLHLHYTFLTFVEHFQMCSFKQWQITRATHNIASLLLKLNFCFKSVNTKTVELSRRNIDALREAVRHTV